MKSLNKLITRNTKSINESYTYRRIKTKSKKVLNELNELKAEKGEVLNCYFSDDRRGFDDGLISATIENGVAYIHVTHFQSRLQDHQVCKF